MPPGALTVRVEVSEPVMLVRERLTESADGNKDKATVPVKLSNVVRVIVEVHDGLEVATVNDCGLAESSKSWPLTVTGMSTDCEKEPLVLVPFTETKYSPGDVLASTVRVNVEVEEPGIVKLVPESTSVNSDSSKELVKDPVPAKLPKGRTVMIELSETTPATSTVRENGSARRVKPDPVTVTVMSTVWNRDRA